MIKLNYLRIIEMNNIFCSELMSTLHIPGYSYIRLISCSKMDPDLMD